MKSKSIVCCCHRWRGCGASGQAAPLGGRVALGVVRLPLRRQRVRAHRLGTWQQHRVVNHALQRCGALVRAVQTGGIVDAVVGGSWGVAAAATRLSAPVVVCSWGVAAVGAARHLVAVYAEVIAAAAGAEGSRGEQVAGGGLCRFFGGRGDEALWWVGGWTGGWKWLCHGCIG